MPQTEPWWSLHWPHFVTQVSELEPSIPYSILELSIVAYGLNTGVDSCVLFYWIKQGDIIQ